MIRVADFQLFAANNSLLHCWIMMDAGPSEEPMRAALYLRISATDGQTTENQRLALGKVAGHRGWEIEDAGISGAKGRDQRPAFKQMLKDAVRRPSDVCMC
jgi:hypothetical protein